MRGQWLGAVAVSACLAVTAGAWGQPRDQAGAEKLYDDGAKLIKDGDWAGGCAKLEQSFALDAATGTLLKLVACAEHDGKIALAWTRLKDARSLNADTKSETQRKEMDAFIDASLARLAPRLPYLTIKLKPAVPGATLTRDGQPTLEGVELPVDPGRRVVEVTAPGHVSVRREIEVAEKQKLVLELELVAEGAASPGPPAEPGPPEPPRPPPQPSAPLPAAGLSGLRVAGIVIGGVGLASLGVALGTGVAALDRQSRLDELPCEPTPRGTLGCPAEQAALASDLSSEGSTLALTSTVTTFVGAGLAGAGLLMALLGGDSAAPERAGRLLPVPGPGDLGLALRGSF